MLEKDENSLSVALKSSKKENTENAKAFEKILSIAEKRWKISVNLNPRNQEQKGKRS